MIRQFATKAEWLAERRKGVSSTDCAAILGLSPWASPLSVYASKITEVSQDHDEETQDRLDFGLAFQRPIAELWAKRNGAELLSYSEGCAEALLIDDERPWLISSIDYVARTRDGRALVEVKNVDVSQAWDWANGNAPAHYEAQLQHELLVAQSLPEPPEYGILLACVGGNRLVIREREIDRRFHDAWLIEAAEFWARVQERNPPPVDGHEATRAVLAGMRRERKTVDLPAEVGDLILERAEVEARMKRDETAKRGIESRILEALGDADTGTLPDGRQVRLGSTGRITVTQPGRRRAAV